MGDRSKTPCVPRRVTSHGRGYATYHWCYWPYHATRRFHLEVAMTLERLARRLHHNRASSADQPDGAEFFTSANEPSEPGLEYVALVAIQTDPLCVTRSPTPHMRPARQF